MRSTQRVNKYEQEAKYRLFISCLKIMEWRANHIAREEKDEKAKEIGEEYKTIRLKLEAISQRRHLALILEENKESILYKKILEIVGNGYSGDTGKEEETNKIYQQIKELIKDYSLEQDELKQNETDEQKKRGDEGER